MTAEPIAKVLHSTAATTFAVTPEQISALRLPTAPAKLTNNRAFVGATRQAKAIAPDVLADIVCRRDRRPHQSRRVNAQA